MELLKWPTFQSDLTINEPFSDSAGNTKPKLFIHKPFHQVFKKNSAREYGSEIGGSGVNFPLHLGETPTHSTEKQSEQTKAAQRL